MTIQIFRGTGRMAIMGMVAFMLAGCATIRNGGAPASLSISSADIVASDKHLFENGVLSKLLSASATIADRNVFINARLLAINMNYNVFASSLGVERQNADAVTQVAQIALGVAGVATAATRTKGIKAIVDKEY